MATKATKRRVNRANPTDEITSALDEVAKNLKDAALLIAEYATNFDGQYKSELDAAATRLRSIRRSVVGAKLSVEDAEDAQ